MMLNEGDVVPDVRLVALDGQQIGPADFRGQKLVLYFYPKDDTTGCTQEAKDFTALAGEFEKAGTWVLGISRDGPDTHRKFIDKHGLTIALASDMDGSACQAFGVWVEKKNYGRTYMGVERSTFLVDRDGRIDRIWRKVRVADHAQTVLAAARELP
jgi:peroxiredoxin Q/BCP